MMMMSGCDSYYGNGNDVSDYDGDDGVGNDDDVPDYDRVGNNNNVWL